MNDGIQMIISKNNLYPHKFIPNISETITATEKRIKKYKRMNVSDSLSNNKSFKHHISAPTREYLCDNESKSSVCRSCEIPYA